MADTPTQKHSDAHLWMLLYIATALGAAWYLRYKPMGVEVNGMAAVLDRWTGHSCLAGPSTVYCVDLSVRENLQAPPQAIQP